MPDTVSSAFKAANRGPLTTIFTPPGSCMTETTLLSFTTTVSNASSSITTITTTAIFINHHTWGDSACYPPTIVTDDAGYTQWKSYYYSPGICPSGYYYACTQTKDPAGNSIVMGSDTTAVLCCPSAWSCVSTNSHGCTSTVTSGQTLTSVWAPQVTPTPNTALDIPSSRNYTTWVVEAHTSAVADGVPVLWANTDWQILSLFGSPFTVPSTASSTGNAASAASSPSNVLAAPTTSSLTVPTETTAAGLSSTAKIGIGISIPIVSVALLLGTFFFFRRQRQIRLHVTHHEIQSRDSGRHSTYKLWSPFDIFKKNNSDIQTAVEADPDNVLLAELKGSGATSHDIPELPSGRTIAPTLELEGDGSVADSGRGIPHLQPAVELYELDSSPSNVVPIAARLHSKFSPANPLNQIPSSPPRPARDEDPVASTGTSDGTDVASPSRTFFSDTLSLSSGASSSIVFETPVTRPNYLFDSRVPTLEITAPTPVKGPR